MSQQDLIQTLAESFGALADEVQSLIDRKTILQHKLAFAHEQYQYLADKYAPAAPEIAETLAKLQLPPDQHHPALTKTNFVPLPRRGQANNSQHQIAVLIREGRRAAQQLSAAAGASKSGSSKLTLTSTDTTMTTLSTMLEQDFTVEGRKGKLECPFSAAKSKTDTITQVDGVAGEANDHTPHRSGDPICAAMLQDSASPPDVNGATPAQCPIRFMDQHSPEEIADYVEKHKHQIPRSHELCVRRYQKNEDQIRKLDAKYGNLVSMITDLSQLHKPMLPTTAEEGEENQAEVDRASNERVENWAQDVTASGPEDPENATDSEREELEVGLDEDRDSHFDRPLKEVRVGESPSRPWGISVPVFDALSHPSQAPPRRDSSPPPAPVRMPSSVSGEVGNSPGLPASKCPFDYTKFALRGAMSSSPLKADDKTSVGLEAEEPVAPPFAPFTPVKEDLPRSTPPQPAFIGSAATKSGQAGGPQMLFTGPVFIGYPIEDAIQFMQHFQNR